MITSLELEPLRGDGDRVRFSTIRGQRVLISDFSGITESAVLRREVEKAKRILADEPEDSVLVLVDISGVPYSLENVQILKDAALYNRRFVRARAVLGVPEIARFSFRAVGQASGRKLESFETVDEALDWLLEQ